MHDEVMKAIAIMNHFSHANHIPDYKKGQNEIARRKQKKPTSLFSVWNDNKFSVDFIVQTENSFAIENRLKNNTSTRSPKYKHTYGPKIRHFVKFQR